MGSSGQSNLNRGNPSPGAGAGGGWRAARGWRGAGVAAAALVPLATLVHRSVSGGWEAQRSAMAALDEFSYLLMARHFMAGGGVSLSSELGNGRDSFYPPGYPLVLAGWGKVFGLSAFTAHALNAVLLGAGTVAVYLFCRRMLLELARGERGRRALSENAAGNLALAIAGVFATNWHVLETSLLILSEPAFMLASFGWLGLAARWPDWPTKPLKALAIAGLAAAAWAIRGAGIVCVAATFLYILIGLWRVRREARRGGWRERMGPLIIAVALPATYQAALAWASPEKSLAAGGNGGHSYTQYLLEGALPKPMAAGTPWGTAARAWTEHFYTLTLGNLMDYMASFTPRQWGNPALGFRTCLGRILGVLGLGGWAFYGARKLGFFATRGASGEAREQPDRARLKLDRAPGQPGGALLEIYIFIYMAVYLIWPFHNARFWAPIVPVMLAYGACVVMGLGVWGRGALRVWVAGAMLVVPLYVAGEEDVLFLGNYGRRLNYVSEVWRASAAAIKRESPAGAKTVVAGLGEDELFAMTWYMTQEAGGREYRIVAPLLHVEAKGGTGERADEMLVRVADEARKVPGERVFFVSYFPGEDARGTLESFGKQRAGDEVVKVEHMGEEVGVWEVKVAGP